MYIQDIIVFVWKVLGWGGTVETRAGSCLLALCAFSLVMYQVLLDVILKTKLVAVLVLGQLWRAALEIKEFE